MVESGTVEQCATNELKYREKTWRLRYALHGSARLLMPVYQRQIITSVLRSIRESELMVVYQVPVDTSPVGLLPVGLLPVATFAGRDY